MEFRKMKTLLLVIATLIVIVAVGSAAMVLRHQRGPFFLLQQTRATKKQSPLYINRELNFSLRLPESSIWSEYVVDDSIRVRDLTIISFKLYDSRGELRTIFDVIVIPGSYSSGAELEELYGSIGDYITRKNNLTFVYRYVYGTQDDSGRIDTILSSAADDVLNIIKSFQTIDNSPVLK